MGWVSCVELRASRYVIERIYRHAMEKKISTSEAKRKLSSVLRRVRGGDSYVVTSRGQPIAHIIPAHKHESTARAARTALLSRLEAQPLVKIGLWMRDELYEDER